MPKGIDESERIFKRRVSAFSEAADDLYFMTSTVLRYDHVAHRTVCAASAKELIY